ncbi:hypothetical protein ACFVMC_32235 [Nocardia sp. NPDC127579]|uniref:hypothetical protein n=1 Tax=Nocardia sp. NPDC127579 TaxID=3345402 RepID=UPI003636D881
MAPTALSRIAAPTAATALVSTGLAIVVNLATGSIDSVWLWLAVAALTALSFGVSLWLHSRQPAAAPAGGIVLHDVEGAGVTAKNIRSTGTGAEITGGRFTGDLTFDGITAGEDPGTP